MDTRTLIRTLKKKLNKVFCDYNQIDKRYADVWLTRFDFGGMYDSGTFVLHVKAQYQIDKSNEELRAIINLLEEKAKDESVFITTVAFYNADEHSPYESDDIIVYTLEDVCA